MQRWSRRGPHPEDFLTLTPARCDRCWLCARVSAVDLERFELAVEFYQLLYQKYRFGILELDSYFAQLRSEALPELARLKRPWPKPT